MKLSDEKLYELCRQYGQHARLWRQKFIGLLPEVNRRHLYEKKGFESIFIFAAKLAGLSHEQVSLALRLEKKFLDKPKLHELLLKGEASLSKLSRVASLATPTNEEELAEKVKLLPQKALETLARDERNSNSENGFPEPLFGSKSMRAHVFNFEISEEVIGQLNELHAQGQDVNAILLRLLAHRQQQIREKKREVAESLPTHSSRTIPIRVREILKEEYGQKCAIKTCSHPARELHHTQRFSLASNHDPHYLAPLCAEHHKIAHTVDQKVQAHWRPLTEAQ